MGSALHGDFGISFQSPTETVIAADRPRLADQHAAGRPGDHARVHASASPRGILSAVNQNTWIDYVVTFVSTLGITVPNFVIALWLLLVFSVGLGWLPTGGWPTGGDRRLADADHAGDHAGARPDRRWWPATPAPAWSRCCTPSTSAPRAPRGCARRRGRLRHALKNALIPLITILGPQIPNLITGHDLRRGDLSRARAGQVLRDAASTCATTR